MCWDLQQACPMYRGTRDKGSPAQPLYLRAHSCPLAESSHQLHWIPKAQESEAQKERQGGQEGVVLIDLDRQTNIRHTNLLPSSPKQSLVSISLPTPAPTWVIKDNHSYFSFLEPAKVPVPQPQPAPGLPWSLEELKGRDYTTTSSPPRGLQWP